MKKFTIFLLVMCLFSIGHTYAQKKRKGNPNARQKNSFLKTQWWLGFTAGANFSSVDATDAYSTFAPINYDPALLAKEYSAMLPGGQAGITIAFFHHGFSFVFEPNFRTQQFEYQNQYTWLSDVTPENTLDITYTHRIHLQYAEIPAYIRYDLLRGKFRPYVQIGGYYSHLLNARKNITTTGTDYASGNSGNFQQQEVSMGANELFVNSNYGVTGGAGLSYDVWNVRFVLGVNYRYGLHNITNETNRFSDNPVADTGDALDNMHLRSIDVAASCVFPLRFISKNLKSTE